MNEREKFEIAANIVFTMEPLSEDILKLMDAENDKNKTELVKAADHMCEAISILTKFAMSKQQGPDSLLSTK